MSPSISSARALAGVRGPGRLVEISSNALMASPARAALGLLRPIEVELKLGRAASGPCNIE